VEEARLLLDRGLEELRLPATAAQREALVGLACLVDRWSARMNLTGYRGLVEVVGGLVLGSAALVAELPELENLVDLGSGAGFPGLPAAILRPRCRVTLVEARLKRHHFQRAAIRSIGVGNAAALHGRADELDASPHAGAVAQAVARPDVALALLLPWVAPGGLAVLPGGQDPPRVGRDERVGEGHVVRYQVPCGGPVRTLWLARVVA